MWESLGAVGECSLEISDVLDNVSNGKSGLKNTSVVLDDVNGLLDNVE